MLWPRLTLLALTLGASSCKEGPPIADQSPPEAQAVTKPTAPLEVKPAPQVAPASTAYVPNVGINGIDAGRDCDTPASPCSKSKSLRASLENAGARWTHLMAKGDYDVAAKTLLDEVDCLVLRGGNDIDPDRFGERKHPSFVPLSAERENFDFALVREALQRKMPVLGICLGAQEVNVALAGDLIQDIPSEIDDEIDHRSDHEIQVVPQTLVFEIYGEATEVHSNHHQSVDAMGKGLRVSATASDGVIEAFEAVDRTSYPFLVGVQYHPEYELGTKHDKLFEALSRACQAYAQRAGSSLPK